MKVKLEKVEETRIVYRGLTGAARALGCSRVHLSYVMKGERKPSAQRTPQPRARRALRACGVTKRLDGSAI